MEDFAIRVTGLSKKYSISNNRSYLKFSERLKQNIFFWKDKHQSLTEDFYALKDISFEVKKGETVGIIGRNGAGKSTLLKILSEVTEPSEGKIEINGKIASVLEVGMGIHPELTGRENVYLSGAMLGLHRDYIEKKFDEIVEFSGVKKFIDTPVKHYSSGMYVRLAFAVVANIDADILLLDEILNVGDVAFRLQCEEKIMSLISDNKTILIVSHNVSDIYKLCEKVMYLENGRLNNFGNKNTINNYLNNTFKYEGVKNYFEDNSKINIIEKFVEDNGNKILKLISYSVSSIGETSNGIKNFKENLKIKLVMENFTDQILNFGFALKLYENYILETGTSYGTNTVDLSKYKNCKITLIFDLPDGIMLASGTYILSFYIVKNDKSILFTNDFLFIIQDNSNLLSVKNKNETFSCAIKAVSKITVTIDSKLDQ